MIENKRLKFIKSIDGYDFYFFYPSLAKWYYKNYDKLHVSRWIRLFIEYISKESYFVVYIAKKDEILGYCLVAPGGRRIKCSAHKDIVLGPYYIREEYRGKGYSKYLINAIIRNLGIEFENAYDYIHYTNLPSIKASEACGLQQCQRVNIVGKTRKLIEDPTGEYIVYRYTPDKCNSDSLQ